MGCWWDYWCLLLFRLRVSFIIDKFDFKIIFILIIYIQSVSKIIVNVFYVLARLIVTDNDLNIALTAAQAYRG